jgi:hypothetical protein
LTSILYYGIDHKVGAVGVLCPRVGKAFRFTATSEAQSRSVEQRYGIGFLKFRPLLVNSQRTHRSFVLPDREGQYLSCLMKCVGAKCTKRCCRVRQRSARRSVSTPTLTAMRSEQFGAVHFVSDAHGQFINPIKR